ncbi:YciI family protein [Actinophytocola sp.]|uniref:YciI family protein n=1 Tax=Actinophytocola sp. TaxID=1872138 RepID=UPI0039C89550
MIWHGAEHSESPEEIDAWPEHRAWLADVRARRVFGARLRPAATTKVQVRRGETLVSDGPHAETKDLIGGVVVIECAHLDEAIEVAAAIRSPRSAPSRSGRSGSERRRRGGGRRGVRGGVGAGRRDADRSDRRLGPRPSRR